METEIKIETDAEFQNIIPPLSEEERKGLERSLVRDGCRDPLVVWRRKEGDLVLLDGHNRHQICRQHDLPFSTVQLELPSRQDALIWICEHQLHRRNLNETQRAMLAEQIATLRQGARTDLSPIGGRSQTAAAKIMKVGGRSIQRAKVVRKHGSPKLIEASTRGVIPVSLGEILTKLPTEEQERLAKECIERGDAEPARIAATRTRRCGAEGKSIAMRMKGLEDLARFAVVLATPWVAQHKYGETVSYNALVPLDEIKAIGDELERHLEHEAVLFLLVPGPLIAEGLAVIEAWRFNYRDQLVWAGGDGGHSDYVTYTHMLVLIADRGIPSKPSPACRPCSATEFAHYVNTVVEMYPNLPKLALFASIARPGWTSSPVTL